MERLGFPVGSVVKNLPTNAGDAGLIPRLERSLEKEMANHSSIPAWEMPWSEESDRLQFMGSQKSQTQHLNSNKNKWNDYGIRLAVF